MCVKDGNSFEEMRAEMSNFKIEFPLVQLKALYFDHLLQNIPYDLHFKDLQSRFTMVNQRWMKRHNVTDLSCVIGKTDYDFFPAELSEVFHKDEQRIISSGKPLVGKVEKIEIEGSPIHWMSVSRFPVIDQQSKTIIGTFCISQELSALTEAEAAMAQERDMLHILLNHSKDSIYFKDLDSRYTRISCAHPALNFVKSPEDAIGKSDFDFFPIEHAQAAFNDEMDIIETGEPILGKIERETAPGMPERWVFTSKLPIKDKQGSIVGTFGISRDITEVKKYENELQKTKRELENRVRVRTSDLQKANSSLKNRISQLDFITAASFQMAQCNSIRTLTKVILKSFSSILGDSVASLCINDSKWFDCMDASGVLSSESQQQIFKEASKIFSPHSSTTAVIIKNWIENVSDFNFWSQLRHLPYYIGIPLLADNRLIGFLQLFANKGAHHRFEEEKNVVLTLASQSAVSLSNAIFQKELNEKAQLKGELQAARNIQQQLTPNHKPAIPGVNLKGLYSPAYEVGGDYLDYFQNDLGYWIVVIADVCGKGVPAAMLMTLLRSSFRNDARNETSAKKLLCSVNDTMRINLDERLFATAICLIISPDGKTMTYAQAGHPRLIRIDSKNSKVQTIETNGIALGVLYDQNAFSDILDEVTIPLVENDSFFLYTDGLTEAFNPNRDTYGTTRLLDLLEEDIGNTPEKISRRIIQDIKAFTQGAAYHDDLTFIVMCVGKSQK